MALHVVVFVLQNHFIIFHEIQQSLQDFFLVQYLYEQIFVISESQKRYDVSEIKHSALISEYVHVKVTVAALLTTDIGINGLPICMFIYMYLRYYFCLIFQWFFDFPC